MKGREEVLLRTGDVSARILELGEEGGTPWHWHAEVTDFVFCLEGSIKVSLADPGEETTLRPGQGFRVAPGRTHRVANAGPGAARYLLLQGIGRYDFNEAR